MNKIKNELRLHNDHRLWNSELSLFQDELKSFEKRLEELVIHNSDLKVRKSIESFQNQFFINKNVISELKNDIQKHEINISKLLSGHNKELNSNNLEYHELISGKIEMQKQVFADLKKEFYAFLTKVV